MGNCCSRQKKDEKVDTSNDNKANEDVTYASINHTNVQGSRRTKATIDNDCDYAIVNIPAALQPEAVSECSSKDECTDDYVLMG